MKAEQITGAPEQVISTTTTTTTTASSLLWQTPERTSSTNRERAHTSGPPSTMPASERSSNLAADDTISLSETKSHRPTSLSMVNDMSKNSKIISLVNFEDNLLKFYERNNPLKVNSVSKILIDYKGKEYELIRKLEKQYSTKFFL